MAIKHFISRQLGEPSGLFGRLVMGRMLDRLNQTINRQTVEALQLQPDDRVLEIGFGGGSAMEMALAQLDQGRVVGVELSEAMVRRAQSHFKKAIQQNRVTVQVGNVEKLDFDDGSFNKVYTVNTLYFWPHPVAALKEIHRVMVPEGRLVVAIRSRDVLEKLDLAKDIFTLYQPEEARDLVLEAGFNEARIEHHEGDKGLDSVLIVASA